MSEVNYDMVIPHYKDEVNLSMLLHDLCEYNKKYKPRNRKWNFVRYKHGIALANQVIGKKIQKTTIYLV